MAIVAMNVDSRKGEVFEGPPGAGPRDASSVDPALWPLMSPAFVQRRLRAADFRDCRPDLVGQLALLREAGLSFEARQQRTEPRQAPEQVAFECGHVAPSEKRSVEGRTLTKVR